MLIPTPSSTQPTLRPVPVELGVSGSVDFTHPAFADFGGDGIRAEGGANFKSMISSRARGA